MIPLFSAQVLRARIVDRARGIPFLRMMRPSAILLGNVDAVELHRFRAKLPDVPSAAIHPVAEEVAVHGLDCRPAAGRG